MLQAVSRDKTLAPVTVSSRWEEEVRSFSSCCDTLAPARHSQGVSTGKGSFPLSHRKWPAAPSVAWNAATQWPRELPPTYRCGQSGTDLDPEQPRLGKSGQRQPCDFSMNKPQQAVTRGTGCSQEQRLSAFWNLQVLITRASNWP